MDLRDRTLAACDMADRAEVQGVALLPCHIVLHTNDVRRMLEGDAKSADTKQARHHETHAVSKKCQAPDFRHVKITLTVATDKPLAECSRVNYAELADSDNNGYFTTPEPKGQDDDERSLIVSCVAREGE